MFVKHSYSYGKALNYYVLAVQVLGDLEKAEELYAESIRIKELILPEYSANLGIGYYNMGALLYTMERYSDALVYFERVVDIRSEERRVGKESRYRGRICMAITRQGRITEIRNIHKRDE